MKKLITPIVIVLAAAIGGGGGFFVKSSGMLAESSASDGEEHADGADEHAAKKDDKKEKHGDSHGKSGIEGPPVFKFRRQFVVPVVKDREPQFMVILDLSLQLSDANLEKAHAFESQLRDVFLGRLFELAGDGVLGGVVGERAARLAVKDALLEAARAILGQDVETVLIQNVGVQNY